MARRILDDLPAGVALFDAEQNLVYCNRSHRRLLGRDIRESGGIEGWLREGCRDASSADEVETAWREHIWQKQLTKVFSLKNDRDQIREIEFQPRLMDDGGLLLALLDVTHARQAEDALKLVESKYRAALQHLASGFALVDKTGRFLDASAAFENFSGHSGAELRRMALEECVAFADVERLREAWARLDGGSGQPVEVALGLRPRTGEALAARLALHPVPGPGGQAWLVLAQASADSSAENVCPPGADGSRAILDPVPGLDQGRDEGIRREIAPGAEQAGPAAASWPRRWRGQLDAMGGLLRLELEATSRGDSVFGAGGVPLLVKAEGRLKAMCRVLDLAGGGDAPVPLLACARALNDDLMFADRGDLRAAPFAAEGDEGLAAEFEAASALALFLAELGLALLWRQQGETAEIHLQEDQGEARMLASVPAGAMPGLSVPVFRRLVESLRGGLQVVSRGDQAEWRLRFPARGFAVQNPDSDG